MTERLERITPEMDEEKALGLILDELMDRADPDVAEAIRFCAIPRWFDEEILAWLRGEEREPSQRTREILAALTELTFVGPYHDRGYAYHENVRDLLLRRWRQENAERFQELSGAAVAYYADKLEVEELSEEQRAEWQREGMYHLLVAGEEQGVALFANMFNRAKNLYQLSTCELLLSLAEEQESDLSRDNRLWLRHRSGQVAYVSTLWNKALKIWEALEGEDLPEDLEGTLANDLGSLYQGKGEWDKAIEYFERSLTIKEKAGDEHGMAPTFNNLGSVYQDKREWDKAIKCFERSLEIRRKVSDEHGMAPTFNNLGEVYRVKGEWDKAIEHYQRSLAICEKTGDEHGMARAFNNLGGMYQDKGELDKAIEYYQRSLKLLEKVGIEYRMAYIFNNIATLYQEQGRLKEAVPLFQKSIEILERIGDEYHAKIGRKSLEQAKRQLEAKKRQG